MMASVSFSLEAQNMYDRHSGSVSKLQAKSPQVNPRTTLHQRDERLVGQKQASQAWTFPIEQGSMQPHWRPA
jgi:hypothetical protein